MPELSNAVQTRMSTLNVVLSSERDRRAVDAAVHSAQGDWTKALETLKGKLSDAAFQKVTLAHSLADWSGDNVALVKKLVATPGIATLRDVAFTMNSVKLAALIQPADVPAGTHGANAAERTKNFAVSLQHKLFTAEPTAVLHRMVGEAEIPIADSNIRSGVTGVLSNLPDFNIRTTSVYSAFKQADAFKGIAAENRTAVAEQLKTLQRVQAISPVPEAVPVLMKVNLTSAFSVAQIPESTFLKAYTPALGEDTARQVYTASTNAHVRNEHALMTMLETMRGSGMTILDGGEKLEVRMKRLQDATDKAGVPLNLETLFGNIDYCECDDCLSVYSPASYFVELLQYLRNNDLQPGKQRSDPKDITNTPLEKLFRRRPDLGCLELTCENTFTVLPYVDLANEVMESFVVHLDKYHVDTNNPKQATLEAFNVIDETTSELLAQPQHVNYQAYCVLKSAVYPFTLPYHQPIDVIRIWLKFFGTSRWEVLDTYRTATETCDIAALTADQLARLKQLHAAVQDRAVDAEFLGITQEEYIILTKQAFWPKEYFDLTVQKSHTDDEYRQKIGVKPVHEYYGYTNEADMLSTDETAKLGLTFVKKQFLPRTGIKYTDLVDLLKTRFINPAYPQGEALTLMESLRFSYRFLQTVVDTSSSDPKVRFAKLIAFLDAAQPLVPMIDALLHPDPCHQQIPECCTQQCDFSNWVYCYFERIGKLIVLESGEGPQLSIDGQLFTDHLIGTLRKDGTVVDKDGNVIGQISLNGQLVWTDGTAFDAKFGAELLIKDTSGETIGFIHANGISGPHEDRVGWLPARDTCDLDKVRLTHLDGTPLTPDEYDRMQRFLRLWRKMGWTMDQTDQALVGLSLTPGGASGGGTAGDCHSVGFDAFKDDCAGTADGKPGDGCGGDGAGDSNCPDVPPAPQDISPEFVHQLVAVRKLLDLTGLPLEKLLVFWADISTAGEKSLYARLFLTHNILGIDTVFQSDKNGNFLSKPEKMSDHMPVLMAALKLKAEDIAAIVASRNLSDSLSLSNVSALYRHALLAKILHAPVSSLSEVIGLLGDPFINADKAVSLLHDWGEMEDAGFTFQQLNYVVQDHDDPKRPLAPKPKTILLTAKTLYDGLNAIDRDNADIPDKKKDDATDDLIRSKAGLIFEAATVEQIIGLLDGTNIYTTNAPADLTITIPPSLVAKVKYETAKAPAPPSAALHLTGILTDAEVTLAKTLSPLPKWAEAIDRAGKQARHFFNDVLYGIFPNAADAAQLLAADVNLPPDPANPAVTDANTAPTKRFYFMNGFLPFLRQKLAHKLVVETLAGVVGLSNDVTDVLLSQILVAGASKEAAISALEKIQQQPAGPATGWKGDLIPTSTDSFTFVVVSDTPPTPLFLNGVSVPFTYQQDDPNNVWWTDPVPLKAATIYKLETGVFPLEWKTATAPRAAIPASALLPNYATEGVTESFIKLFKSALIANGFTLNADEVLYLQTHATDFDQFEFNAVTIQHWRRLRAYTKLRDELAQTNTSLLDLFKWAGKPDDPSKLSAQIAAVTNWKQIDIDSLVQPAHFDLNRPEAFRNEVNLVKLQKAIKLASSIGVGIDRLFDWANPLSQFSVCHEIAGQVQAALRARFDQEDWESAVKPLYDQLRQDEQAALVAYLLVQQDLIDWGVVDADSLFEFFLIDVQMCSCMNTSRIKQAISSVQSFIQRCLLGLEAKYGVPSDALDRQRWEWMQKYRVWEANRKVFLYPENWIKSELRDDKSPFYKELESELLQKDINTQTVEDALKSYLFKVDEVANLKVVGLYLDDQNSTLHVFARTRNAPYFFYYRYFRTDEQNWYPWSKVEVDIPSFDVEGSDGKIFNHGTYVAPAVWNNRLLIFFPQFFKKTQPVEIIIKETGKPDRKPTVKDLADIPFANDGPSEFWEIKLAWSEFRNNRWTPKQMSKDAIYDSEEVLPSGFSLGGAVEATRTKLRTTVISNYLFIPRIMSATSDLVIDVVRFNTVCGAFHFQGSQVMSTSAGIGGVPAQTAWSNFQFNDVASEDKLYSQQAMDNNPPALFTLEPIYDNSPGAAITLKEDGFTYPFVDAVAHQVVSQLATGGLDELFNYYATKIPDDSPTIPRKQEAFGGSALPTVYHELKRAYSLYNWEAAFHVPMLVVDRLVAAQQFDQALKMCHKVLTPFAAGTATDPFWQFPPFREIEAENVLEKLFLGLQPNAPNGDINEWRDKPFQPHAVARRRPSAYMKWVAMKYIQIWIAYGDYYFRQNTLETIPLAIQCYVMASHVYGPPGELIPKRGKTVPQTYRSLLDKWDAFGNAMVELELVFPFSNQTSLPIGVSNGVVGLANVFGFATTLYFCIPDNPQLRSLRATIDDRLFKIRHCEDIDGVFRQLPLFEPPIDPGLLVQAAAQGLSLSSVLNDLNSPMPNYRFYYLLQKALEMCSELKALGNAFLSAKEKGDAESLAQLRARHESSIHNLVMEVKKQQLDESTKSLEALQQSRKGPVYRLQHNLKLIGEDLAKVPDADADYGELPDQIEQPVDESGLKLIPFEKEEMDKASEAASKQEDIGDVEVLASILNVIPNFSGQIEPFGVGMTISFGGSNLGSAAQAVARSMQIVVGNRTFSSTQAGRKAGFLRQLQDRVQQANVAGYEIKNIDKQVLTQQIRINIAQQEITNQQKQIDNAQEVEEFLRNKYSNQELYTWMEGEVRGLYYQAYTLAYDLAKKAEKLFRFERGLTTSSFVQYGYWDASHDGLLSGERLYQGLKQLEAAYQEKRGHDFEISKTISLRQLDPLALLQLRETGSCEVSLPEVLFDMDYPGHFMRRIKSVALRVPCVLGTHTSLNCTLRLLEHKFRTNPIVNGKSDYPERTDGSENRFTTVNVPITAIAVSSLEDEAGVFELNFRDDRYLPFEGAGIISKWRIELPDTFRQFDYDTMTDVIFRFRYTSMDGGDKLKQPASGSVTDFIKSVEDLSREQGLFAAFDIRNDFSDAWYTANHPVAGATERVMKITTLNEKLPLFTKGRSAAKIQATDIYLFATGSLSAAAFTATQGGNDITFTDGPAVGSMKSFVAKGAGSAMDDLEIHIADTKTAIDKIWLLERYVLA